METISPTVERVKGFDEQYKKPEKIQTKDGETFELFHVVPGHLRDKSPIILSHGHPSSAIVMEENIHTLFERGREVFFPFSPKGIEIDPRIKQSNKERNEEQTVAELRRASADLKVIEDKNLNNIDGVAFSEGALHLVIAAMEKPEKFRSLTLVNASGLMGKTAFPQFILGGTKHHFFDKKIRLKKAISTGKYLRPETFDERISPDAKDNAQDLETLKAIPKADILDALVYLKNQGINIKIFHTPDDLIYPLEKVQKMLEKKGLSDLLEVVEGGHTAFSSNPERFAKYIDSRLNNLKQKSST